MNSRHSIRYIFVLLFAVLGGCASMPDPVETRFDTASGLTWVTMDEAIVLARSTPQFAVAARDYLYIGPIETNRAGDREHYLWLGTATTVDRDLRGASSSQSDMLLLIVDDTRIALELASWAVELEARAYETQVPISTTQRARVSLDQIHRIASAQSIEVHLISGDERPVRYELWRGDWLSWQQFPRPSPSEALSARLEDR